MPIKTVYLGLQRPSLVVASEYLLDRFARDGVADLSGVIVVVPGSRAGRRLLEILVASATARSLVFTPPQIETVGNVPEELYRPQRPFASELLQRLVWADTLLDATPRTLSPLVPHPPPRTQIDAWLSLADLLRRQHVELAADGLHFGHVIERGEFSEESEMRRWKALRRLQESYLKRLDNLELWDRQTARLVAIEKQECAIDRELVLIGTVDLNIALRRMLDQVAERVTALVVAEPAWKAQFDTHGCLIPQAWEKVSVAIPDEVIEVVEGPADQAAAVARAVAKWAGDFRADEIVIGVPDESLLGELERKLASRGVSVCWGPGRLLTELSPASLLQAAASYLDRDRLSDFAALVRHPDLERFYREQRVPAQWLEQLDEYGARHLPSRVTTEWLGDPERTKALVRLGVAIRTLLRPVAGAARRLADWSGPWQEVLRHVYGGRTLDKELLEDREILAVCRGITSALNQFLEIPPAIAPEVTAAQAIRMALEIMRSETLPAERQDDSLELLGWLELPLDDAPALIVTSFNEGYVPESVTSDLFLPDGLRQRLGLLDNQRRYARDVYASSVLLATKQRLHIVVGRVRQTQDPLSPSRILFSVDDEVAAERALRFFRPSQVLASSAPAPRESQLRIPRPQPLAEPVASIAVTSFRDYLSCPYRFYLSRVLKLRRVGGSNREMDGRSFGTLAHEVLQAFGKSGFRDSTDAEEIFSVLNADLEKSYVRAFGPHPLPAVLVQIEQLRLRLRAFAERQAAWASEGWRIEATEVPAGWDQFAPFDVDGQVMRLVGRIDRIDVHPATGRRAVLDYKTSDAGNDPEKSHRKKKEEWVDLQLPLYRHLCRLIGIEGPVLLGFILLPKDTEKTAFSFADWDEGTLAGADEVARSVIRRIRKEEFWPPTFPAPEFSEDWADICQDDVFERERF